MCKKRFSGEFFLMNHQIKSARPEKSSSTAVKVNTFRVKNGVLETGLQYCRLTTRWRHCRGNEGFQRRNCSIFELIILIELYYETITQEEEQADRVEKKQEKMLVSNLLGFLSGEAAGTV